MACRRMLLAGRELLRAAAADGLAPTGGLGQRAAFSSLPDDLAVAAARARFPARRAVQPSAAAEAAAAAPQAAAADAAAAVAKQVGA